MARDLGVGKRVVAMARIEGTQVIMVTDADGTTTVLYGVG